MQLQVGVKILLKNEKGRYLLLHRSSKKYSGNSSMWDIPGGRIILGSGLVDNLRRELREETNLGIAGEPELIAAQDILRVKGRHVVRLTYRGKAKGKIKLDLEEHDDYRWVTLKDLNNLADLDIYLTEVVKHLLIK